MDKRSGRSTHSGVQLEVGSWAEEEQGSRSYALDINCHPHRQS